MFVSSSLCVARPATKTWLAGLGMRRSGVPIHFSKTFVFLCYRTLFCCRCFSAVVVGEGTGGGEGGQGARRFFLCGGKSGENTGADNGLVGVDGVEKAYLDRLIGDLELT